MMSMRLAYRIATQPVIAAPWLLAQPGVDAANVRARVDAEVEVVRNCPKFRFDNVAEFYYQHDRQLWDVGEDIPNWAPPFPHFFVEWNEPRSINKGDHVQERECDSQAGFHCIALNVNDDTRGNLDMWEAALIGVSGYSGKDAELRKHLANGLPDARWVLYLTSWFSTNAKPLSCRALWMGYNYFLIVNKEGRQLDQVVIGVNPQIAAEYGMDSLWSPIHVFGLGLSFLHCKNVAVVEQAESRGERWHRRTRCPVLKFHTLNINPMREVLRTEGRSEEVGIQRALHICRGHFATYTEDRPLFGRHTGTFYRPSHVRGKATSGVVQKDYNVNPN